MRKFEQLNAEVALEVKNLLRVYDEVNVTFENGEYSVLAGMCIKRTYAPDYEFVGAYRKEEILTEEEQVIAYIEEFIEFPRQYKGERDWTMINEMKKLRSKGQWVKIKLVDGNAVIDRIEEIKF